MGVLCGVSDSDGVSVLRVPATERDPEEEAAAGSAVSGDSGVKLGSTLTSSGGIAPAGALLAWAEVPADAMTVTI